MKLERDRLRAQLKSQEAELRRVSDMKDSLEGDLGRLQASTTATPPPAIRTSPRASSERSHEEQQEYIAKLESRTAELETTVQDQIAAGTEEKKRLRELVDANTKDLAELSAEWGQRNQLQARSSQHPVFCVPAKGLSVWGAQEARINELLLQSENAAKDARESASSPWNRVTKAEGVCVLQDG